MAQRGGSSNEAAHNGLATAPDPRRVPGHWAPRLRGLCASNEPAHNGLATAPDPRRVPGHWAPRLRGLCAFEEYIAVDWSAAATPRTGADSIWIAHGSRTWNPPTRSEACALLEGLLARRRGRVLAGFDFSFGYPAGFAAAIGARSWIDVWREIDRRIVDRDDNSNNRFEAAASWNREISGRASPFWGCPAGAESEYLSARKTPLPEGIGELRACDRRVRGIQSPWKLYTTGSVGSQMLTGIPRLLRLREQTARSAVWPFEDWRGADVVFAEIYPSLLRLPPRAARPKDKAQVLAAVRWMRELGEAAFEVRADPVEGAILGVVP